jgi:GTP-binding protein
LKINSAEFVRSAASASGFPRDPVPQVAFVGRSNVGKSSLINALARQRIARTSAAAGKTRHVNIYRLSVAGQGPGRLYLVDLPGYGYARGGARSAEQFEALTTAYFGCPSWQDASEHGAPLGPTAALLVVDARHPGLAADRAAGSWLSSRGRPYAAVAAKVDKLTRAERARAVREWQEALQVPILPTSAVTGEGLNELWTAISRLLEISRTRTPATSA